MRVVGAQTNHFDICMTRDEATALLEFIQEHSCCCSPLEEPLMEALGIEKPQYSGPSAPRPHPRPAQAWQLP